jgi:hypothetical protein
MMQHRYRGFDNPIDSGCTRNVPFAPWRSLTTGNFAIQQSVRLGFSAASSFGKLPRRLPTRSKIQLLPGGTKALHYSIDIGLFSCRSSAIDAHPGRKKH